MKTVIATIFSLALASCAPIFDPQAPVKNFQPYTMAMLNFPAYENDRATCLNIALAYPHTFDLQSLGVAAGQGAASNLPGIAVSPLAPALGAAGAGGNELLNELGLLTADEKKIMARCMSYLGRKSGLYEIIDPNL